MSDFEDEEYVADEEENLLPWEDPPNPFDDSPDEDEVKPKKKTKVKVVTSKSQPEKSKGKKIRRSQRRARNLMSRDLSRHRKRQILPKKIFMQPCVKNLAILDSDRKYKKKLSRNCVSEIGNGSCLSDYEYLLIFR